MKMKSFALAAMLFGCSYTQTFAESQPSPSPTPEISNSVTDTNQNSGLPKQVVMPGLKVLQPSTTYVRPNGKTRAKRYFNSMFGPVSLVQAASVAGITTWRNSPEEWGPGWEGFGKRFASNVGKGVIKDSITFGMDEALKVDSHFYRSEKRDTGSRIKNALISPFTARKPNGKRTIGLPRLVGTYSANIIASETWYPNRDYKDGLRSGTISLGFNAAFNC
jgi:hypothetical protein